MPGRRLSTIWVSGMTKVWSPTVTIMPSSTASVRGRLSEKLDPLPSSDWMPMRPPSAWMFLRTTSMPTPRPEMLETTAAVEKPGAKIRLSISSSDSCASGAMMPRSIALALTRARSMPRPSSATVMTMRPDWCAADRVTTPSPSLPAALRSAGVSRPWSTALRIRWVSGSPMRSTTVLSTSVISPSTSKRTRLPVSTSSSRMMRGTRLKTVFIGWARIAIVESCSSRVR